MKKSELTEIQRRVTQENGTEPPFDNEYWDNHEDGIYVDLLSGKPLFSSRDKFDSGCGWPSFSRPVGKSEVAEKIDLSHGMIRTEVRTRETDYHLGHVFSDGPRELGGQRYCINSAAIRFVPRDKMAEEGYEEYLSIFD